MRAASFRSRLFLIIAATTLTAVPACADFSDFFADWTGLFSGGIDPNAGLTAFPVLQIPMGGRYEGMGTAYTAISSDLSFGDSNPAASAGLSTPRISFSHRNWTADSAIDSVAVAFPADRMAYGFALKFLHEPFTQYDDSGEPLTSGLISETVLIGNLSFELLSMSRLSLALGTNAKLAYRHIPDKFAPNQSAFAMPMDIGLVAAFPLWDLTRSGRHSFSAGMALKNLGQRLQKLDAPLPTVFSAGVGYSPTDVVLVTLDANVPVSFDAERYPAERPSFALGSSVRVARFLSLHTGVLYKGANPRVAMGAQIDLRGIVIVTNYNLDLMGKLNPLDKFSAEVSIPIGGGA